MTPFRSRKNNSLLRLLPRRQVQFICQDWQLQLQLGIPLTTNFHHAKRISINSQQAMLHLCNPFKHPHTPIVVKRRHTIRNRRREQLRQQVPEVVEKQKLTLHRHVSIARELI